MSSIFSVILSFFTLAFALTAFAIPIRIDQLAIQINSLQVTPKLVASSDREKLKHELEKQIKKKQAEEKRRAKKPQTS